MGHPPATSPAGATAGVSVKVSDRYVEIKNGIFELTLSNPDGIVTGVRYNGVDNLMEILNKEDNRGCLLTILLTLFILSLICLISKYNSLVLLGSCHILQVYIC
jgi:hypothetical protein